jgi:SAM-dependent methyltransferase
MNQLIQQLKESDQDFEFYPTTDEIIAALIRDTSAFKEANRYDYKRGFNSVLDIGAGNGKVLRALQGGCGFSELYAIEKSIVLCQHLDPSIFIVGTEFHEQSLVAKQVDVTFCNPPYSEFEAWSTKIIRESSSKVVYLVIPVRWEKSVEIAAAIKYREAKYRTVGKFSFQDAEDRTARAIVHLIRIELAVEKDDAFDRFFNEQFAGLKAKFEAAGVDPDAEGKKNRQEDVQNPKFASLVVGANYPERMVELYNDELDHIRKNYDLVAQLDVDLLKEFDVTPVRILGCLKARLTGLRNTYWKELFAHMKQVTDRLTHKKRNRMLETLNANGHVDFTVGNIHAVILWVLKNANNYLDEQLIETFEAMVESANVRNYVSNQRPFVHDRWRYNEEKPSHIALEYRMVLQRMGGVNKEWSGKEQSLNETACDFLGDLLTVARNLGFDSNTDDRRLNRWDRTIWRSGECQEFYCNNVIEIGHSDTLFEVRAFLNGNIHLRMNQDFSLALNVEYGRLKGWLKNGAQAAEELGDKNAPKYFGKQLQLGAHSLLMLGAPTPAPEVKPSAPTNQPADLFADCDEPGVLAKAS